MFKPVRWKTFPRDLFVIEIGFLLFGLAITLMIRANLGTSAWAVLEVALAQKLRITIGTMTVLMGFLVLSGALIMREKLGWGTLGNILSIGPWEDMWLSIIPSIKDNLPLQIGMLLVAILLMGLASAIYIGVDSGALRYFWDPKTKKLSQDQSWVVKPMEKGQTTSDAPSRRAVV